MKIEIWSDVACPFCWIGKHHFEQAVRQMNLEGVEVEWKSFELDPQVQKEYKDDLYTLLANKYGQTREWAINSANHMKEKGQEVGLEFNFDHTISTNTFDAHRLIHLAKAHGKQNEAEEALFVAYFKDGKHVSNHDVLVEVGSKIGLPEEEIKTMLVSDQFSREVRADEQLGQEFGISGVPFFVVNRKYGISGAQPVSAFINTLTKAKSEEAPLIVEENKDGEVCGPDGCDV